MAGKSGSASSNLLDILPFEKWGEKLAESTVAQAKAEQGWVREGGAARGSNSNAGVIGGDAAAIRENARRIELEDREEDEHAGLLAAAEAGRPTPGRSSGRQISFDTPPATATYGREEFPITKGQIIALVLAVPAPEYPMCICLYSNLSLSLSLSVSVSVSVCLCVKSIFPGAGSRPARRGAACLDVGLVLTSDS